MNIRNSLALLALAALPLSALADIPGQHPGYLHALSDLRAARWNLEHRPGDAAITSQEDVAVVEIDRAIEEVRHAAAEDEKDQRDLPREDARMDRPGRLHHAVELLQKAHDDLSIEEDNPEARGLKHRSMEHVDRALEAARHAIGDFERGR